MAVIPSGFALPALPYFVGLLLGLGLVGGTLWRLAPAVTAGTVLGMAPWMVVGSALHALFVLDAAPAVVAPLVGAPAVYVTVFIGFGTVWAVALTSRDDPRDVATVLGLAGTVAFVLAVIALLASAGTVALFWPTVGVAVAGVVTAGSWGLLGRTRPEAVTTGTAGVLVVFAHVLDGISTAIGVDVLGFGERTPLSRMIMDAAGALPTAETLGVGWLFAVVKLAVALAVVVLFSDLIEEDPRQGYLLLAIVAAVGLGPGVHNLLLYAVAG